MARKMQEWEKEGERDRMRRGDEREGEMRRRTEKREHTQTEGGGEEGMCQHRPTEPHGSTNPGSVVLQVAAFVLNGVRVSQLFQKLDLLNDVLPLLPKHKKSHTHRVTPYRYADICNDYGCDSAAGLDKTASITVKNVLVGFMSFMP